MEELSMLENLTFFLLVLFVTGFVSKREEYSALTKALNNGSKGFINSIDSQHWLKRRYTQANNLADIHGCTICVYD
jgi:hypothetical protein